MSMLADGAGQRRWLKEYERWLASHVKRRKGERRGRLERGHQHGERLFLEQVWWPLVGNLDHLHPEYEVMDWRGRSFFVDFVWKLGRSKLAIEIKGYASHVRDLDRKRFSMELNRENFLKATGYDVVCFAYDDVEQQPELCISLLRLVLSRYRTEGEAVPLFELREREVLRQVVASSGEIRPVEVSRNLGIDPKTAVLVLQSLCDKGWLTPVQGPTAQRTVLYKLVPAFLPERLD